MKKRGGLTGLYQITKFL